MLLASYNPKHPLGLSNEVVEIHICDHHLHGNTTHSILSMKVIPSPMEGLKFMVERDNSLFSEFDPMYIAGAIGLWIGSNGGPNTVSFLQPKK